MTGRIYFQSILRKSFKIPCIDNTGRNILRINTSLIGDTVQFAVTLNNNQMEDPLFTSQFAEIEFHGAILDVNPAGMLA